MQYRAVYAPRKAAGRRGNPVAAAPPAAPCRPWLRLQRDPEHYAACMAIAESIGPIDGSAKAAKIIASAVGDEDQEVFGALYLDTHAQVRGLAETARGEIDSVAAPVQPTLRLAIETGAQAMVIFHTHPTLYTKPSAPDRALTRRFAKSAAEVDVLLLDHLIIGGHERYYSFADAGLLK